MKTPKVELLNYYYPKEVMKQILQISDGRDVPIEVIVKRDYSSVLEHIVFTFKITCSIAISRELLEHRIASHTARSTRYCDESEFDIILPPLQSVDKKEKERLVKLIFEDVVSVTRQWYRALQRTYGKEIARYVLPLATETQYILTMNARSLINFFGLRLCVRASPEIREIAEQMLKYCREIAPEIFNFVGCRGVNMGVCPEGKARPDNCPYRSKIPTKEVMEDERKEE